MIVKTLICDDNEKARYILKEYLKIISAKEIEVIGEAENGYGLIELCKKNCPDLILLDIDMPFINGIETAKKIIEFLPNVTFIFITAYPSYSLEAFEVHPVDFILKPISTDRLEKSINYIIKQFSKNQPTQENSCFTISSSHSLFPINQNDILYIERVKRKSLIHTSNKILEVNDSLDNIHEKFDSKLFFRAHNSYLVNINAVHKINKRTGGSHEINFKHYNSSAYVSRRNLIKLNNILKNVIK